MNTKICNGCKVEKPLSEFGKRPERNGAPRSRCKQCSNAARDLKRNSAYNSRAAKQWRANNPEKKRAYAKQYNANNPERADAWAKRSSAKWRAANRELAVKRSLASRAKKPDYYREQTAAWQKANPARCRAKYKAYMTQKMRAMPKWANESRIVETYELAQRRTKATGFSWHVDHLVPLQSPRVCGLHWEGNLKVIPGVENLSKNNRSWPDQ